jgi:hypothetical protein
MSPRVKWGIDPDEPEELESFDIYDGPDLKSGVYQGNLMRLTIVKNRNDDDMLKGMWQVDDPAKPQYKGAVLWFNQNITDQGKPYVLQWLKSLGLTWDDFTKRTVIEDADYSASSPSKVTKIGRLKFNDGNEVPCRVSVGLSKSTPEYPERKPEIKNWLPPKDDEWDADDDGDGEPDDSPF